MKDDLLNFCKNVKKLRQEHGLSETKMAKVMHVSIKTLRKIENGEAPPRLSADVIFWLESYFGIKPNELFME